MQDSYYDMEHYVSAHLMDFGNDQWLLTELQTNAYFSTRGQGHGGRLLARVLEDADREGVTLCLSLNPDGSVGSLDYETLASFYGRRGFVFVAEGAMRREPQPAVEPSAAAGAEV